MRKIIFSILAVLLLVQSAHGSLTYGQAYYVQNRSAMGSASGNDPLYQFIGEVDTALDSVPTWANGLTMDNAVNNTLEINENSEEIILTFSDNALAWSSTSGVVLWDFGVIVPKSDQFLYDPISTAVGTVEGTVYYDSDTDKLFVRNSSTWVDLTAGAGTPGGSDTQMQYNDNSVFGGIAGIIWDDTNLEFADDQSAAFGTAADWTVNFDDSEDDQLLWLTAATTAGATTDPLFEILVGASPTADQQVFGVGKGTQVSNTALFTVDEDGDGEFAGSLTLGSTLYQTAIISAAAGNVALTIDAAGNGTITVAGTSTGATIFTRDVDLNGATTDIGDASSDTLTITSKVDSDVVIDDDTTNSPALVLRDAGENDWQFVKVDGATGNLTATSDAGTSDFQIVTGNLKVGGGSEGVTLNGQDAYVTGTFEVDGAVQFDGDVALTDQLLVTLADNDEEVTITGTATNMTAAGQLTMTLAAQDSVKHSLRLIHTPDGDADNEFIILQDAAGANNLFEIEDGGNTIWTLDAASVLQVDAASTIDTSTAGVINLDVTSATANNKAIYIDYELDDGGSGTQYGIYIDLDDDGAAADETFHAVSILNSAGTDAVTIGLNVATEIDTGVNIVTGAAGQAIVVDASTAHTETAGVIDIGASSATDTASAVNIDLEVGDLGAAESVAAIYIDTDDDTASNAAFVRGIHLNTSDIAGHASTINQAIYVAGFDAALQADNGYVRIGTGATPDVTPGDDDLFVEGTAEIDGDVRLDGNTDMNGDIVGAGPTTYIEGMVCQVEEYAGADNVITIAESGKVFTNEDDGDGSQHTLPEVSTAIGCVFTFIVTENQNLVIELDNADIFLHLTLGAGDQLQSSTIGDSITVVGLDDDNWGIVSAYPLAGDWADGGP